MAAPLAETRHQCWRPAPCSTCHGSTKAWGVVGRTLLRTKCLLLGMVRRGQGAAAGAIQWFAVLHWLWRSRFEYQQPCKAAAPNSLEYNRCAVCLAAPEHGSNMQLSIVSAMSQVPHADP
jgi:hypothetical protein